jgi:hypothetical protein
MISGLPSMVVLLTAILSLLDALKQSVNGRHGKSTAPKAGEKTPRKRARRTA